MSNETAVAEKPATKAAKPAATKKQTKKEDPAPIPFDLNGFVREHGGVHLSKPSELDHVGFKVTAHVCTDEKAGFYYTFNTYLYPTGVLSRGKKNQGGNSYPLKGHRHTVESTNSKGQHQKDVRKGTKTAEEIIPIFEKKGYVRTAKPTRSAKSSGSLSAVKSNAAIPAVKPVVAAAPTPAPVPVPEPTPPAAPVAVVAPVVQEPVTSAKQ